MALSRQQDYWIHPNALSITLNYFGDPQQIQTSMLAGAVILAYEKNVITYDAAHNFREWQLQAYPTYLADTCKYYVHAELSRTGHTAMVIYSPTKRDLEGRTFIDGAWDTTTSDTSWFIYLGEISASVDANGATVERVWTDGLHTGTLATDQHRMEEAQGEWSKMFQFNSVNEEIEPQHPFSTIKVAGEAIFQSVAKFIRGIVLGGKTLTTVAGTTDIQDQSKVNDSTLPTTGYVKKELDALDDHFLIKDDADTEQSVAGFVNFEKDVTVHGDHSVGGNQTVSGSQTIGGTQEVKEVQTLYKGFKTPNFFQQGDIIQGAQVDADGNAAFTSITAPVMQIYELQYNRKTAVQEEFIFSDGDTIETVTYIQDDGTEIDSTVYNGEEYSYIRLGVRKQYEGYMTTFKDEDILYSNVNIIGESGRPATTGKCWMRVLALNNDLGVEPISSDGLFINALLYSTSQCPAGVNMAPTPHMVISRHGNANGILHPDRQSVFIISTKAENMVQLRGISSPIIPDTGAYAIVSGKLPSTLLAKVQKAAAYISENDPVSYARYGIFENLIQLDHEGLPIKTERYRGAWSKEVAMSDEPYTIELTTYDTVTHDGSLWTCQQSGTISEPSDTSTEWIKKVSKGSDASAIIYEIKPSANIVYVKGGSLSTNNLDVIIGRTDSNGYFDIADQAYLDSLGLLVQWAIDGGERHDLNISPDEPIDLEDESGELLAENGNALLLEGETIDISSIKDNITLYLVDTTTGNDMAERIIPVVKDGENGKDGKDGVSPYTIIATPSNINVLVNANDESIISDVEAAVYIYVKKGTSDIEPTMYYVDADEFETNSATQGIVELINPIAQSGNKRWRVKIRINKGSYKQSDIPSLIRVKVFDRYATDNENNPLLIGYADVTPSISQRGLVGPAGEAGPLLFPSGRLEFGVEYDVVYDVTDTSKVVAQPFFYNQTDEVYYVLQKKITAAENTEANLGNTDYWRPFTKIQYLFTEALMANWGKLASAVFWGNYQFSQYGLKDDLTKIDASAFSDTMFTNGRLNGTITPNLFLDFLSGMIKTNKLSETFKEFDYYSPREKAYVYNATSKTYEEMADTPMLLCSNEIDFNSSYNIKMDSGTKFANINTDDEPITGWSNDCRLLTMPLIEDIARDGNTFVRGMDWEPDGIHASVILRPDDSWREERYVIQNRTNWTNEHLSTYLAYGAMLCADARLFDQHSYIYAENTQQCKFFPIDNWDAVSEYSTVEKAVQGGFFVVNGEITKFLFLEPGSMVRLRSCTSKLRYGGTERKVTLWYVENADEFAEIPVYVRFNGNFYMTSDGKFEAHSYEHTYGKSTFGAGINYTNRVFGSKIFKTVIDNIQADGAYAEPVVNINARPDIVTEKWEDSIAQITWQYSLT